MDKKANIPQCAIKEFAQNLTAHFASENKELVAAAKAIEKNRKAMLQRKAALLRGGGKRISATGYMQRVSAETANTAQRLRSLAGLATDQCLVITEATTVYKSRLGSRLLGDEFTMLPYRDVERAAVKLAAETAEVKRAAAVKEAHARAAADVLQTEYKDLLAAIDSLEVYEREQQQELQRLQALQRQKQLRDFRDPKIHATKQSAAAKALN